MTPDTADVVALLRNLFEERGDSAYGGEAVSQRQHALQAAHLAAQSNAGDSLVVAALLHDVGHLLHHLPDNAPDEGVDDLHENLAGRWLARWFPDEVVEPVRLHVAAKRYLCAVDPSYEARLSGPSQHSLELQGGPMTREEVARFQSSFHHKAAVALRHWDDAAKDPAAAVAPFETYIPMLEATLAASSRQQGSP